MLTNLGLLLSLLCGFLLRSLQDRRQGVLWDGADSLGRGDNSVLRVVSAVHGSALHGHDARTSSLFGGCLLLALVVLSFAAALVI